MNSGSTSHPARDTTLDALRAVAVITMVIWHVTDGWIADVHRQGMAWHAVRVFGGLAAPLFLFVAGVAVRRAREAGRGVDGIVMRGVSILALGGLLRLQTWLVDAGGAMEWRSLAPAALGIAGYGSLLLAEYRRDRRLWVIAVALLIVFGWRVGLDVPEHAARILAVDVLSCIGAAVVFVALASRLPPPAVLLLGIVVVCATDAMPTVDDAWAAGWLGAPHPQSARYALFPLVPWAGYTFVGFGLASALRARPSSLLLAGVAIAVMCFEGGLPWSRRLVHDTPALRPLARFGFHLGATLALCGTASVLKSCAPLTSLGRISLPVYWLHLQLAFGLLSLPFARASGPLVCALGAALILLVATAAAAGARGVLRWPTSWKRARASGANSRA